ncbi:MAG: hypothetical protein Q9161_003285 [Pseudevernia consocians]
MGGIAFEIPENLPKSKEFLPSNTCGTWFVNPWMIDALSLDETGRREVLPNLSKEEIESKSKANGVAKALHTRKLNSCAVAQRIPISLLELNTFGHAVCALLVYLLWWEKPFEVDYPTMIQSHILWDFLALQWMQENRSPAAESYIRDLKTFSKNLDWSRFSEVGFPLLFPKPAF